MPDQSHPPYAAGSKTIPRTLIRWLDINAQNGSLRRCQTFITLPSFVQVTSTWNGYSDIVASFNCEAPNNFSLTGLISEVPASPNYTLCISYRVGGVVTRYILWEATGTVSVGYPMYNGQPIKKNFRFEVWNTSQGAASQSLAINLYTSVKGGQDYRYSGDVALKVVDAENDSFSLAIGSNLIPPTAFTNVIINNIVVGDEYSYGLTGAIQDGSNVYIGSGTFIAQNVTVEYGPYVPNPQPQLDFLYNITEDTYIYQLPLIFPSTSVSTTN